MPMGFRDNSKGTKEIEKKYTSKIGEHLMIEAPTGAGKTRFALQLHKEKSKEKQGILWFDPKNKLHQELKCISKDINNIFLIGAPAGGTNDISINLFQKILESESSSKRFAYSVIANDLSNGHNFWAEAGAEMLYNSMNFCYSIQEIIKIKEKYKSENTEYFNLSKVISDDVFFEKYLKGTLKNFSFSENNNTKEEFMFDSKPITFQSFHKLLSNQVIFKILCLHSTMIADFFLREFKNKLYGMEITDEDARKLDKFINKMKNYATILSSYNLSEDSSETSGINGVYMSMLNSIPSELHLDKVLNSVRDTHNIIDLLESGKHIIVSKDSKFISSSIFNYVTDVLSLRSSKTNATPITIFIEEASRVLTSETDLEATLAYARESKLSVIFIVQSRTQIIEIFGDNKSYSIFENITIIKVGSINENKGKKYKFNPNFNNEEKILEAELKYQKATKQYLEINKNKNEVVIFDNRLYEIRESILLINIKTKETREVKYYFNDNETESYFYIPNDLKSKVISEIGNLTFYLNSKECYDRDIQAQCDAWIENTPEYTQRFEYIDYGSSDDNNDEIAF